MKTISDEQVVREAAKMAGWSTEELKGKTKELLGCMIWKDDNTSYYTKLAPLNTDALLELAGALKFIDGCVEVELDMFDGYWKSEAWLTSNSVDALLAGAMNESIVTAFRSALLALLRQVVEEKINVE